MDEYTLIDKRIKTFKSNHIAGATEVLTLSEMRGAIEGEKRIIQFCNTLILRPIDSEAHQNQVSVVCEFEFHNYQSVKAETLYRSFIHAFVYYFEEIQKSQYLKDIGVIETLKPDVFERKKQGLQNIINYWNE